MTAVKAFVTKHPVASYFALTFAISWGGVLFIIGGPSATTAVQAQDDPLFPFAVAAMLAGPSVAGMVLAGLVEGVAGIRVLRARLLKWRVGIRWYAVALLTAPLLASAISVTLSTFSPEFFPGILVTRDARAVLILGLAVGLMAGFFEELGWTGFAIPRLRRCYGVRSTGLIVGAVWSAWHLLVVTWGIGDRAGTLPVALFILVDSLAMLPAFRLLMTMVYDRTESLLLAVLMHFSLTASTLILTPLTIGAPLLVYEVVFAGAVWGVIAAIGQIDGGRRLPGRPLERSAA